MAHALAASAQKPKKKQEITLILSPKLQMARLMILQLQLQLLLSLHCTTPTHAQLAAPTSEQTISTTSSVDIQVCIGGVLSDERTAVEQAVLSTLTQGLATSAVYPTRQYTTSQGAVCYMFVYQAPSPSAAQMTETVLGQLSGSSGSSASVLPVIYHNTNIQAFTLFLAFLL